MIAIYNEDAIEHVAKMKTESIDLIVTDPPYGISYRTSWRSDKQHRFCREIVNDKDLSAFSAISKQLFRVLKNDSAIFVFCAWRKSAETMSILEGSGFKVANQIIWDKGNTTAGDLTGSFGYQYEVIIYAKKGSPKLRGKRFSDIWRYARVSPDKLKHQNEKPVFLLERAIIAFSDEGGVIFDPFAGSGSTGVAAINLNRGFVGCEIDQDYFEIADERLKKEQDQGRLAI